ncbi:MAG: ATPase [Bacteroidota bacterium]|nr:ATPase [Bacteroidota bacterium]
MSRQPVLIAGLDAGGTSTRLCARTLSHEPDLLLMGPAANARRHGVKHAVEVIADLVRQARTKRPHATLRALFAGVAGAGQPAVKAALESGLREKLDSCRINVTHDGIIALEGALEGKCGLLIAAGTGSGVFARTSDGNTVQAGGWGAALGDEGSGYAIGREGLAAAAHAVDGGPATELSALLKHRFRLCSRQDILAHVYDQGAPLQQIAPLVLKAADRQDAIAIAIVESQTRALVRQASWLLKQHPTLWPRYTVWGGLAQSEYYVTILRTHMRRIWPAAGWCAPVHNALEGAVRLALRSLSDSAAG